MGSRHERAPESRPEFKILNRGYVPSWRDPKHKIAEPKNYAVGTLSLICFVLALKPHQNGYGEPISMQIARGELGAWFLFGVIFFTVASALPTFFKRRAYGSILFCLVAMVGLGGVAETDPFSSIHLSFFLTLVLGLLLWVWSISVLLGEIMLYVAAMIVLFGAFICFFSLGIGERTVIGGALVAMNAMCYLDVW